MKRRGFILVVTLMVCILLFLMGMAYMTQTYLRYRGSYQATYQAQALALARAGLEDVRQKLDRDVNFPPIPDESQKQFGYTEPVTDTGGNQVGSYTVLIDLSLKDAPFSILRITSVGTAGTMAQPVARHQLYGEVELDATRPHFFEFIQTVDEGSL